MGECRGYIHCSPEARFIWAVGITKVIDPKVRLTELLDASDQVLGT